MSTEAPKHTALPWEDEDGLIGKMNEDLPWTFIASFKSPQDCEFAVLAVNNHKKLVDALKGFVEALQDGPENMGFMQADILVQDASALLATLNTPTE